MIRRTRLLGALMSALLAGCAPDTDVPRDGTGAAETSSATSQPPRASAAQWTVTATGWGPIRAGMTLAEARAVVGGALAEPSNRECDHVRPPSGPAGVLLMIADGRVARVEVRDTTVATAAGARVGDTEERINALYRGRVQSGPHKYVEGGRYLVLRPDVASDDAYRLVFETDGRRVTRYRGGRMPEVEWVEGCG